MSRARVPNYLTDYRVEALRLQRLHNPGWSSWHQRTLDIVTGIDVHHAAAVASADRIIESAAQRGGSVPLGYFAIIEPGGTVFVVAEPHDIVYHNGGGGRYTYPNGDTAPWSVANHTRLGVCFSGNFDVESGGNLGGPLDSQVAGFNLLAGWIVNDLGVPFNLKGHSEWKATACPGDGWHMWKSKLHPSSGTSEYDLGWNDALDAVMASVRGLGK